MIPIGKKGQIIQGESPGWFVLVQDNSVNTGGFLILTAEDREFKGKGFDNWVENKEALEQFFRFAKWEIDWLE